MSLSVEFKDVTPHGFKIGGISSFSVRVERQELGDLILMPDKWTLAWNGRMRLETLEEEVLRELPRSISTISETMVGIVSVLTRDGQLSEYSFADCDDPKLLRELLVDPEAHSKIGFVRLNALIMIKPLTIRSTDFSFTVENAADEGENELAVMLPRTIPASGSLIEWVMRHHVSPPQLGQPPDYDSIARALSRKVGLG